MPQSRRTLDNFMEELAALVAHEVGHSLGLDHLEPGLGAGHVDAVGLLAAHGEQGEEHGKPHHGVTPSVWQAVQVSCTWQDEQLFGSSRAFTPWVARKPGGWGLAVMAPRPS